MSDSTSGEARRTPLYDEHVAAGARMVDFAGWAMPVQYQSILAEHQAVRTAAGLFDVSHMGEVEIAGPAAEALCADGEGRKEQGRKDRVGKFGVHGLSSNGIRRGRGLRGHPER